MTRNATLGLGAFLVGALVAGASTYAAMRTLGASEGSQVRGYALLRAPVVSARSRQVEDGYVLIAGDSHAELAEPDPPSCGRRLVNAGVSGAKADDYAEFLDRVTLAHRPAVAIVTLGTNHLLRKRDPTGAAAADAYERDLERVVRALKESAGRVLVAAIPPAASAIDAFVDRAGVANLTGRQAALCARLGCETVDPYAGYRDADFGTAKPGASRDGLHLSDYRPAYRAIDAALCR